MEIPVYASTGAFVTRANGRNFHLIPRIAPLLDCDGLEFMMYESWAGQEAEIAAEYVDLLQVPAFLCRQTDLLEACAKSGRPVNIKKGQFLAPWDTVNIGEKMRAFGCDEFMMCERGTTFGYNNLVVDMRSLYWMKQAGFPVVFDATHAVQKPGGLGGTTGGDSELAPVLASAAMATGSIDGVFMEVHKDPSKALSDGPNQIPLHLLEGVLKRLQSIHQAVQS